MSVEQRQAQRGAPSKPRQQDDAERSSHLKGSSDWDRLAERIHLVAGCGYLALATLATSTESIGYAILLGATLLRAPALATFWWRMLRSPVVLLLGAWFAWSALSLLWSPDPDTGRLMLKGVRAFGVLLAIAPLSGHLPALISSVLAGAALQGFLQLLQLFGVLPPVRQGLLRFAGLASHPGMLGVFQAAAIVMAASWLVALIRGGAGSVRTPLPLAVGADGPAARRRAIMALLGVLVLTSTGLGISAARAAMIAVVAALPVTLAAQLLASVRRPRVGPSIERRFERTEVETGDSQAADADQRSGRSVAGRSQSSSERRTRRRAAMVSAAGIIALSLCCIFVIPFVLNAQGFAMQFDQFRNLRDAGSSAGSRLVYWSGAWEAWQAKPIAGFGAGGTRIALQPTRRVQEALAAHPERDIDFFAPLHPHSIYVQTALEQGIIGALLLAALLILVLRQGVLRLREAALAAAVLGGVLVWCAAAAFDALHVSGRMACFGCALIGMTWPCGPRGAAGSGHTKSDQRASPAGAASAAPQRHSSEAGT
jgi:hypothetical protein